MAQIPGSVPLTGKVAPTDDTDTFATHVDIYGEGGYMTVANTTERDAITSERRKQGMAVFVNDTNEMYILQDGVTNADWVLFSGGGGNLAIEDEGTQLTAAAAKINFTGAGVTASAVGDDVTVNIPGGGGNPDMQDVFDNSTPNITALDATKTLSLSAGTTNILTDTGSGGSGEITIQSGDAGKIVELQLDSANAEVNLTSHGLINSKAIDTAVSSDRFSEVSAGINQGISGATSKLTSQGDQFDGFITTTVSASKVQSSIIYSNQLYLDALAGVSNLTSWNNLTCSSNNTLTIQGGNIVEITSTGIKTEMQLDTASITGKAKISQILSGGKYVNKIEAYGSFGTRDITVAENSISISLDSNPSKGDVLANKLTSGASYGDLEWQPGVQQLKVNLTDAEVQALHTTPIDIILSGNIPSNKFLNVLTVMCYCRSNYTNSETLKFYIDSCTTGGGSTYPIYQAALITSFAVGTGTYATRQTASPSFGSNCQALTVALTGASGAVVNTDGTGGIDVYVSYQYIDK